VPRPNPKTPDRIAIRGATSADAPAVLALVQRARLLETGIAEGIAGFVVAEHAGAVIASAGLESYGSDALLRSVAVAPESRGRGLGRLLVESALRRAATPELSAVYLLTTTARDFFAKLGFEAVARSAAPPGIREAWEFKSGCPQSAVFMRWTRRSAEARRA
jgi:amino-acid N-acetyltransferase